MTNYRRALWLYPMFQIPLVCLGIFLTAAILFWLLKFGRPQVAVAIALDLSNSTRGEGIEQIYDSSTIVGQEIQAVRAYLNLNDSGILKNPNQIKIFGFAGKIKPLNSNFDTDSKKVEREMSQTLESTAIFDEVSSNSTDINLAIETGIAELKSVSNRCKELLIVTDEDGKLDDSSSSWSELDVLNSQIKINAIVFGAKITKQDRKSNENEKLILHRATTITGGDIFFEDINKITSLFTEKFFKVFNSNSKWIVFWLGLAWISLMWLLVLPLDQWILQGIFALTMDISGRLALANALFWTVLTSVLLWKFWGIPFFSGC